MAATVAQAFVCESCGASKDSERTPRGWKRWEGALLCDQCVTNQYCVRAIALPIDRVIDPPLEEGESFFSRFNRAWRLSTDLANWAQRQLLIRDVVRMPSWTTLPKWQRFNLYGLFTAEYPDRPLWDGAAGSASALLEAVRQGWCYGRANRSRYAVLWRGDSSAAHFRWPYPWIVRSAETTVAWQDGPEGRIPTIRVSLPGGKQTFSLATGANYRRALRDFAALVDGRARLGDTKIVGRFRNGRLCGVEVRIAGRFPRAVKRETGLAAVIQTRSDMLLQVTVPGRQQPWNLHMPHLKGLIAGRDDRLVRIREDTKYEKRWPAKKRARIFAADEPAADRYHRRIKTAIEQAANQTIAFVERSGCDRVEYDDSVRDYLERFQWHELKQKLKNQCERRNIRFAEFRADGE